MTKLSKIVLIVAVGLVVLTFSILRNTNNTKIEQSLPADLIKAYNEMTLESFMEKYQLHKAEMDFLEDFDVVMDETTIKYNITNTDQTIDVDKCTMIQSIHFNNRTNRLIKVYVKCFVPDELFSTIVYAGSDFGSLNFYDVKVGGNIGGESGALMKHFDKLTSKEKDLYEAYKNDLYILLSYEDKEYFIKVDDLKVVIQK